MKSWLITVPKTIAWNIYERELIAAEHQGAILNYRLGNYVGVMRGDRVYIVWNGRVRGWMTALGVTKYPTGFECSTTGVFWEPGFYLQRSGKFRVIDCGPMRGFRGIRAFTPPKDDP